MRTKLALLFAVVLGILAVVGIQAYLGIKHREAQEGRTPVAIAIAKETLVPGTVLRAIHIGRWEVEEAAVTEDHILYDQADRYFGREVTEKVTAQKALLKRYFLAPPEEGEFAMRKVDTDMRAMTIGTDQIAGVAGLITPGSHVDILCTFRVQARGPETTDVVTRIIASNVEALAVDNRTDLRIPVRRGRLARGLEAGYSSVTVHVTPLEAAMLTFAQQTGKLSFALRHAADMSAPLVEPVTLSRFDAIVDAAAQDRQRLMEKRSSTAPR